MKSQETSCDEMAGEGSQSERIPKQINLPWEEAKLGCLGCRWPTKASKALMAREERRPGVDTHMRGEAETRPTRAPTQAGWRKCHHDLVGATKT